MVHICLRDVSPYLALFCIICENMIMICECPKNISLTMKFAHKKMFENDENHQSVFRLFLKFLWHVFVGDFRASPMTMDDSMDDIDFVYNLVMGDEKKIWGYIILYTF